MGVALATGVAASPGAASSPDPIRAAKRLINTATPVDAARVLVAEAFEQQRLIGSANQREAVQAALENRAMPY